MPLEIRTLGTVDGDRLWEIVKSCKTQLNLNAELDWSEESLKAAVKSTQIIGLLNAVERNNNKSCIIGFILYRGLSYEAELDLVVLDPEYHGQGLIKMLLDSLSHRFVELWLEVHIKNFRAIQFYKKSGFNVVRVRKKYYKDGADCIVMRRFSPYRS
jgi:ribosomal protein S18 acetylase RimI-like enzyme